jgi:hypothetical protein
MPSDPGKFGRVEPCEWVPPGGNLHEPRMPRFDAREISERQACEFGERKHAGNAKIGVRKFVTDKPSFCRRNVVPESRPRKRIRSRPPR